MAIKYEEVCEARKALGLSSNPKYKLPKRKLLGMKQKWEDEPVVIAGVSRCQEQLTLEAAKQCDAEEDQ